MRWLGDGWFFEGRGDLGESIAAGGDNMLF
jgi:hypothetical protein